MWPFSMIAESCRPSTSPGGGLPGKTEVTVAVNVSVGADYLGVCRRAADEADPLAKEAMEGIEAVLAGRRSEFTLEYPCHSPTQHRWFFMNVVRPLGGVQGAVIMHLDITERKRAEDAQAFLTTCGYGGPADDFFKSLANYLAKTLNMDYVCIDRLLEDGQTARTVAICFDGRFEDDVAYTLKDTPCGDAVGKTVCCYPREVRHLFPKDAILQDVAAESYVGTTLWSSEGKPIGLIAVIGRQPLKDPHLAESILKLVALRAAHELERQEAEEALRQSERHLRNVLDSLFVFVGVLTPEGVLVETNRSTLEASGLNSEDIIGVPFEETYPWSWSPDVQGPASGSDPQGRRWESLALRRGGPAQGRQAQADRLHARPAVR